jgi:hypothetical protein
MTAMNLDNLQRFGDLSGIKIEATRESSSQSGERLEHDGAAPSSKLHDR